MKKKYIIIASVTALLIGAFVVLEKLKVTDFVHKKNGATSQQSGPTDAEKQAEAKFDADAKKQLIEGNANQNNTGTTTSPPNIELSAKQDSSSSVTVFTKLFNTPSGSCSLQVTNGANKNEQTAEIIYQTEYSTCAGFTVPVSKVGTGTWNIKLSVSSNGQLNSKAVTLEVR